MHVSKYVCMYECAMMCYLEAGGVSGLHASAEEADHLRCEGKFEVGMKVVCYNKKWGPSDVEVTLNTGGAMRYRSSLVIRSR